MAVTCNACGLKNPKSAVMCDCGNVLNHDVDSATLAGAVRANQDMRRRRNVAAPIGIGAAVVIVLVILRLILRAIMMT
jgi:hypothetical protein